jgi:hypothetical protein
MWDRRVYPDQAYLLECFKYDSVTGIVRWRFRPEYHFANKNVFKGWNVKYAGRKVDGLNDNGYIQVAVDNTKWLLHRLIWKLHTGNDPPEYIDHKDHARSNNKWNNLRAATKSQNNMHRKQQHGLYYDKRWGKWNVKIKKDRKTTYLGAFDSKEEALAVRKAAEKKYFGAFAP